MKRKVTASEIYDELLNVDRITTLAGLIEFHMGDVSIRVKRKDVVGNILQEWLEGWLDARNIDFIPNPNTQMPPDIFLDTQDITRGLLEVKAFNREGNPGFDIADFKTFVNELIEKPYHIETDYLIFGYIMDESTGTVTVKDLWLKKVWEITKPMSTWPLTVQYKNNILHKIRPGNWFSERAGGKVFENMEDFLSAFEETIYQNVETRQSASQWKNKFLKSYRKHYGHDIDFPRWEDIRHKYGR